VRYVSCVKCGRSIEASARFCPHCGTRQAKGDAWYYHPVWILVLAFLAVGPFALILVWKSRRMGLAVKAAMTVVILVYSAYTGYAFYKIMALEMQLFKDLSGTMQFR
jgi:hypothetical protein